MTVARVTTITSRSERSFEDAVAGGVARASETLRGIEGATVRDQLVTVEEGRVVTWQVTLEVTFVLDG